MANGEQTIKFQNNDCMYCGRAGVLDHSGSVCKFYGTIFTLGRTLYSRALRFQQCRRFMHDNRYGNGGVWQTTLLREEVDDYYTPLSNISRVLSFIDATSVANDDEASSKKRKRIKPLHEKPVSNILATTLTPNSIIDLVKSVNSINDIKLENITHLLVSALTLEQSAVVGTHTYGHVSHLYSKPDPDTWLPLLAAIRRNNPSVKLILTHDYIYGVQGLAPQLSSITFWDHLLTLLLFTCADGFLLNLEFEEDLTSAIAFDHLEKLRLLGFEIWAQDCYLARRNKQQAFLKLFDRILIRSYGFMRFSAVNGFKLEDCELSDFEQSFYGFSAICERSRLCMCIDTCGIMAIKSAVRVNDKDITTVMLPLKQLRQITYSRKILWHDITVDLYPRAHCYVGNYTENGILYEMCISFDTDLLFEKKINFIREWKMKGIVLGDMAYDDPFNSDFSLIKRVQKSSLVQPAN